MEVEKEEYTSTHTEKRPCTRVDAKHEGITNWSTRVSNTISRADASCFFVLSG
jgi:hypothetical protein